MKTFLECRETHTDTSDPAACWTWGGHLDRDGYGRGSNGKKSHHLAHRLAYMEANGPIPVGLTIDHLCRNRACVNPAHLEAVTFAENMRRAQPYRDYGSNRGGGVTHCKFGHPYDQVNTYVSPQGRRGCRACNRAAVARCKAAKVAS